jgi:hypothetical protein
LCNHLKAKKHSKQQSHTAKTNRKRDAASKQHTKQQSQATKSSNKVKQQSQATQSNNKDKTQQVTVFQYLHASF